MSWYSNYNKWKNFTGLDVELKEQLSMLEKDPRQLEDSFYKMLEFGTGGIRGEIGPGTNRINIYTIRKAAEGLAQSIIDDGEEAKKRGVVIAYDSRFKSYEFALETTKTLGKHDIQTYLFESLRTTPELSFAVRYLNAYSGVVITASHNPSEYNGFKVYDKYGAQISPAVAEKIIAKVNAVEDELNIVVADERALKDAGLLNIISDTVDQAYLEKLQTIHVNPEIISQVADEFKIVYTPLHGTGNIPVRKALALAGFKHVKIVKEQEFPDPNFSTVDSPNPEEHAAFELAMKYGEDYDADMLLGTDPDTDRLGVAVRNHRGDYEVLTGNQVGALLLHYLVTEKKKQGKLETDATVLKTIVTSEIGRDIATAYGLRTLDMLTGFKFIGEKINEFEETGNQSFLFGYEESYGYLIGDFVRDKDAIQACLLMAEVGAYYRSKNMTVYEGLLSIFDQYGYYQEGLESLTLKNKDGIAQINAILRDFRENPPIELDGKKVLVREDYQSGIRLIVDSGKKEMITLPKSNVIKYKLENDSWFCLRPSGTEPKIKIYFGVKEDTMEISKQKLNGLRKVVMERVKNIKK